MPGDHGRKVRNTLEQHAYGHQRHSPPVGQQGPREPQLGAHYGASEVMVGAVPVQTQDGGWKAAGSKVEAAQVPDLEHRLKTGIVARIGEE